MPVATVTGEKRSHQRWRVWGVRGRIAPDHEVALLDISEAGALIEHAHPVRQGTVLFLTLPSDAHQAPLKCRVVRSLEHHYEVMPTGECGHAYRSGLEFAAPCDESQQLIKEYLRTWHSSALALR